MRDGLINCNEWWLQFNSSLVNCKLWYLKTKAMVLGFDGVPEHQENCVASICLAGPQMSVNSFLCGSMSSWRRPTYLTLNNSGIVLSIGIAFKIFELPPKPRFLEREGNFRMHQKSHPLVIKHALSSVIYFYFSKS